jgi:hypothetical protein
MLIFKNVMKLNVFSIIGEKVAVSFLPCKSVNGISGTPYPTGVKSELILRHEIPTGVRLARIWGIIYPTGV